MEVILYSKECNWYTRCCPLNGGVRYRECPLREAILYMYMACKLFERPMKTDLLHVFARGGTGSDGKNF